MHDVITIGGATRDITFVTDKGKVIETPENLIEQSLIAFEHGAKIKSDEVHFNYGGGACNAAATFVKLGINVSVNCRVGNDDEGESVTKNLKKMGIDAGLIQVDEKRKTGFSLVVVNKNDGDRVIFVYKGASDSLEVKGEVFAGKTKWIYLTSLDGKWEENLKEIEKAVKENGIKLAWNPGAIQIIAGRKKLKKLFETTEILIINKDEAIELIQSQGDIKLDFNQINDPVVLAQNLKNWGPKIVVITDGTDGAYLYSGGEHTLFSPATSRKKIDATGAGDSFGSALVGGYMLTGNCETALKYGIINSGSVVNEYGAQNGILSKAEIEKALDKFKVSYL